MPRRQTSESHQLQKRAEGSLPGGVSSYARKFEEPLHFDYGSGSKIYDVDGNEYIDYLNAWGAIILGHSHPEVNDAVSDVLANQDLYGYGTSELEIEVAESITDNIPSASRATFGVTGSEVTAAAIRLARGVTDRQKVIKFQGHYHGWYDSLAMNHLTDENDLGGKDPFSEGLLEEATDQTIVLPFNDAETVERTLEEHEDDIAAIILEPIAHNMGCVVPKNGYLEALRNLCNKHGTLLIFDEIITGFRHHLGGVQALEGVTPDLTTLGKSVANGYPISVLCGKAEYMDKFVTAGGNVSYGGTYNAHAGSLAAARETMRLLEDSNFHTSAIDKRDRICAAIEDIVDDEGIAATVEKYGTVFLTYFMEETPENYRDILDHNAELYQQYRREMMDRGILYVPKDVRRNYILEQHTEEDIDHTIEATKEAFNALNF